MNKTAATKKLQDEIESAHDWKEGQVYGGSGTYLSSTDECRICGLTRRWTSDKQNGNYGETTYKTAKGDDLTTREAAALRPCVERERLSTR